MRRLAPGPQPAITDYQTLLGERLRLYFDMRQNVEFGPGAVRSWTDSQRSLKLSPISPANLPIAAADGGNFRGLPVIKFNSGSTVGLVNDRMPGLLPLGARPAIFAVARIHDWSGPRVVCGVSSGNAGGVGGASLAVPDGTRFEAEIGGSFLDLTYTDTTAVHWFYAENVNNVINVYVNNVSIGSGGGAATALPITRAFVGAQSAPGLTASVGMFLASWGVIDTPLTAAERAVFFAITRDIWRF